MPVIVHGTNYDRHVCLASNDTRAALGGTEAAQGESEAIAGKRRSRHQQSKSGPAPMDSFLASYRGGVGHPGPSRQPDGWNQPPTASSNPHRNPSQVQPNPPRKPDSPAPQPPPDRGNDHRKQQTLQMCNNRNRSAGVYVYETYDPCDCMRCSIRSRSVCVSQLTRAALDSRRMRDILTEHFTGWGNVEFCEIILTSQKVPYALIRFTSEDSAIQAVDEADGQPITHLTDKAKVTHPFYSKYYVAQIPPPRYGTKDHRRYWEKRMLDQVSAVPVQGRASQPKRKGKAPATAAIPSQISPPSRLNAELPPRPAPLGISYPFNIAQAGQLSWPIHNQNPVPSHDDGHRPWPMSYTQHSRQAGVQIPPMAGGPLPWPYVEPHGWPGSQMPLSSGPLNHHQSFQPHGYPPPPAYPLPTPATQQVQPFEIPSAALMEFTQLPVQQAQDVSSRGVQTQTKLPSGEALLGEVHARSQPTSSDGNRGPIRVRLPSMSSDAHVTVSDVEGGAVSDVARGVPITEDLEVEREVCTQGHTSLVQVPDGQVSGVQQTSDWQSNNSRPMAGDIRLEPDFSDTVIHRPAPRRHNPRIPSIWRSPYVGPSDDQGAPPVAQDQPKPKKKKKGRNKKKAANNTESRPETPSLSHQGIQPAACLAGTPGCSNDNTGESVLSPKQENHPCAEGSLRIPRQRNNRIGINFTCLEEDDIPAEQTERQSSSPTPDQGSDIAEPHPPAEKNEEPQEKSEYNPNGNFRGLPKGFYPFPHEPSQYSRVEPASDPKLMVQVGECAAAPQHKGELPSPRTESVGILTPVNRLASSGQPVRTHPHCTSE